MFTLQYPISQIRTWAERYKIEDDKGVESIALQVQAIGYYTKYQFLTLCHWKTPRSKPRVENNPDDFICEVTRTALSTPSERLRIEVLTLLSGVSWPTASVLLHFGYKDIYPILDFRALWSLGLDSNQVIYDFDFWWSYTQFCRKLASECGVSMRVLDRALWQYSVECQGK